MDVVLGLERISLKVKCTGKEYFSLSFKERD